MSAVPVQLTIFRGSDFTVDLTVRQYTGQALPLTGYTVTAFMARNYTTNVKYDLHPTVENPSNGTITLNVKDAISLTLLGGSLSGDYAIGETITGLTSGSTAKVISWNGSNNLKIASMSGDFIDGETIKGSVSSANYVLNSGSNITKSTTSLDFKSGRYVYDIFIESGLGVKDKVITGIITVEPSVL